MIEYDELRETTNSATQADEGRSVYFLGLIFVLYRRVICFLHDGIRPRTNWLLLHQASLLK